MLLESWNIGLVSFNLKHSNVLQEKFKLTGSVMVEPRTGRPVCVVAEEN
jgi:hypothetical protein